MAVDLGTGYLEVKPKFDPSSQAQVEGQFKSMSSRISAGMTKVGKGMTIGLTAPLVLFGKSALSAFEESSKVGGVFTKTLENVGLASKISSEQVQDDFSAIGESIGIDDEAMTQLAGKLASAIDVTKFGPDAQKTLEQITLTVENMSVQTGKSANTYAKLFASLANDPKSALGPLTKLGVITKDQADKYAKMIENGKGAVVQQDLLSAANKKFAGAAAAAATPTEKFSVAWGNFQESIGEFILPVISAIGAALTKVMHVFQDLSPGVRKFIVAILAALAALGPLLLILAKLISAGKTVGPVFVKIGTLFKSTLIPMVQKLWAVLMANPWVLIAAAVIALVIIIIKNWDTIKRFLLKVWDVLKRAGLAVWNAIKSAGIALFNALKKPVELYLSFWKHVFGVYKAVALAVWNTIKSVAGAVWRAITGIVKREIDGLTRIFKVLRDAIVGGWHVIENIGKGVWDAIKHAAALAFNGIANLWNSTIGALRFEIPSFIPVIGGKGWDVPDIPTVALAKGGIVMMPTLSMLGEAHRREAVLPLPTGFDLRSLAGPRHMTGTLTLTPESRAYVEMITDDDAGSRARHARVLRRMGSAA